MGQIYVLRSSELTPRAGGREKGMSSDFPRGLSHFYVHTGFHGTTAPKLNSQATLRKGQQFPGNEMPSRVRRGWLFSPCELSRISQNTANQGAPTRQRAELKCQLPGKPGVSPKKLKVPTKFCFLQMGAFLILVEACFRPSDREAQKQPLSLILWTTCSQNTPGLHSLQSQPTLQPRHLSSINDWTHGCFSEQRPDLPPISNRAGPLRRDFSKV